MKKTILISGIKGFLGSHLAAALKAEWTVYGVGKATGNIDGIQVFPSDGIESVEITPEYVIMCHAAVSSGQVAQPADLLFEVNVGLTQRLIDKFSGSKIVYVSSASVYGTANEAVTENFAVNPKTDYAVSKLEGEKAALNAENAVVIRLSSLYGKHMKEVTIIPNYVNQALQNKKIEVWGKGERMQNYLAVDDACDCIKAVIENFDAVNRKTLLCVGDKEHSNDELAKIIAAGTGSEIIYVNQDTSPSVRYDNSATKKLLDWSPKTVLNKGITHYIQWKKEQF